MIIYNFIKYLILYIRYNNILQQVYKEEHLIEGLSKVLNTEFKIDWIGRVYAVINPYVINGEYDPTYMITELGKDVPTEMAVEKYIMERFNLISRFVHDNNIFDMLSFNIKKLDKYNNFLLVLCPLPYEDLKKYTIRLFYIIGIALLLLISFCTVCILL